MARAKFFSSICFLGPFLLAAAGPSVSAAQSTGGDETHRSATSSAIEEVVVTARKRAEVLQDVPLAIDAFSGEQLTQRGVINFEQLGQISPSVYLQRPADSPAALYLTIRGLSQSDIGLTTSSSVGVYVDGVYLPYQMGLRQTMFDVQRVELLKGPQGTLYGKNTTGGAINVFTTQPGDTFGGYVKGTYGRFDTRSLEGAVTVPLEPGVASVRLAGYVNHRDALGRNDAGYPLDNDDTYGLRAHILFTPTSKLSITVSANTLRVRHGGGRERLTSINTLGNPRGLPTTAITEGAAERFGFPAGLTAANLATVQTLLLGYVADGEDHSSSPARSEFDGSGVATTVNYDFGPVALKSITSYRKIRRYDVIDTDATPFDIVYPIFTMHDGAFSQETNLSGVTDKLNWIAGVYYARDTGWFRTVSTALRLLNPTNPTLAQGDVTNSLWGVYSQATYKLTDQVSFTGGYRYTEETKGLVSRNANAAGCNVPVSRLDRPGFCQGTFKDKFTGPSYLASVDYKPTDDILIYAKTSRAFRGGGQNERGTSVPVSFAPFRPEVGIDYELGLKSDWFERQLRINAAIYRINYRDVQKTIIIPDPVTGALATVTANAAKARIYGGELEATWRATPELTFNGSAAITHPKYLKFLDRNIDRSKDPWRVPKQQYTFGVDYQVPASFGEIQAHVDYYWQSKVVFDAQGFNLDAASQKAYGLINARLGVVLESSDLEIAAFATNLLNKKYLANAVGLDGALGYNIGYYGEPRIFGVQVKKSFGEN